MSTYDDTKGDDLPDISDLISSTEETPSLDDFLSRRIKSETATSERLNNEVVNASPASIVEGIKSGVADLAESNLRVLEPRQEPKGQQDSRPNGSAPEPVIPTVEPEGTRVAQSPHEPRTVVEIRNHPILGNYISEQQVVDDSVDAWYTEVWLNSKNLGVSDMQPEQIIDMMHNMEEAIKRSKAAIQGLRAALEVHLGKMNVTKRAELLERDAKYRAPRKVKTTSETATIPRKSKASNPIEKSIKSFKESMGMTKDEIVKEIGDRGKMTPEIKEYIDKLFSL